MHCDGTIEKWDFGPGVDLENKFGSVSSGSGGAESIQNVTIEFSFRNEHEPAYLSGGTGYISDSDHIVSSNQNAVTIAILDSGIDVNYPAFDSSPFLYNAAHHGISGLHAGWDYVNEDNNCYDDYEQVHGTGVSSFIHTSLNRAEVPFQLLPVKIANQDGEVSIFNMLCGMMFSLPKADILQVSAGWYDAVNNNLHTLDIFLDLLSQYEDVLVVTSAGNYSNNNDSNIAHYPSNFSAMISNVIAVGATNEDVTDAAYFTNYGRHTVDFMSNGTNLPFMNRIGQPVSVSGTSFSTPLVTAVAAKILYGSNMTYSPAEIKQQLDNDGIPVTYTKQTRYNKYITPLYW
jgi:subtilisin family serine protease